MKEYNINTSEGREAFINNYPTGYYMGADESRNEFVIYLTQGEGMVKTTVGPDVEDEVVNYDSHGNEVKEV